MTVDVAELLRRRRDVRAAIRDEARADADDLRRIRPTASEVLLDLHAVAHAQAGENIGGRAVHGEHPTVRGNRRVAADADGRDLAIHDRDFASVIIRARRLAIIFIVENEAVRAALCVDAADELRDAAGRNLAGIRDWPEDRLVVRPQADGAALDVRRADDRAVDLRHTDEVAVPVEERRVDGRDGVLAVGNRRELRESRHLAAAERRPPRVARGIGLEEIRREPAAFLPDFVLVLHEAGRELPGDRAVRQAGLLRRFLRRRDFLRGLRCRRRVADFLSAGFARLRACRARCRRRRDGIDEDACGLRELSGRRLAAWRELERHVDLAALRRPLDGLHAAALERRLGDARLHCHALQHERDRAAVV